MIERLAILALVLSAVWLGIWLWERRRVTGPELLPGITVVDGPHCKLCEPVVNAIRNADPEAELRIVDIGQMDDATIRSLPTVFVVDMDGNQVMRRSGRSALTDAETIARVARERGPQSRTSKIA